MALRIGKTTDRVAAGEILAITTATGEVIYATAITAISGSSIAYEQIAGKWVAFDAARSSITSQRKALSRTTPKKSKKVLPELYPFKGLVKTTGELYIGGNNNIILLDDTVIPELLALANTGLETSDFVAIWRKNNDLIFVRASMITTTPDWFLQGYDAYGDFVGYAVDGKWRGTNFYGVNNYSIYRTVEANEYHGDDNWGVSYTVLPWVANMPLINIPNFTGFADGFRDIFADDSDNYRADKTYTSEDARTDIVVACNFGSFLQGVDNSSGTINITFQEIWTRRYTKSEGELISLIFQRSVIGTRQGHSTKNKNWQVFMSLTETASCYDNLSIDYGGSLNIQNLWYSDTLHDPSSLAMNDYKSDLYFDTSDSSFTQFGTTSENRTHSFDITNLWISGDLCFLYTKDSYSLAFGANVSYSSDTDKAIATGYQYGPNLEDRLWQDFGKSVSGPTPWFVTNLTETWDRTSLLGFGTSTKIICKIPGKNMAIPVDTNSAAFFIDSQDFTIGETVSLPCVSQMGVTGILDYEIALKYTLNYSATDRESPLEGEFVVEKWSDDTAYNTMINNLLSQAYDIIWKEGTKYYIGDATIIDYNGFDGSNFVVPQGEDILWFDIKLRDIEYIQSRFFFIERVTFIINSKTEIHASLLGNLQEKGAYGSACIISRDNYYSYLAGLIPPPISTDYGIINSNYFIPNNVNLFLRDNPIIATTNQPLSNEIDNNRTMYAEILELLPNGRWVRRAEESGSATSIPGEPQDYIWNYYKP